MNKAFVRESEDSGQGNCPRCGSLGLLVGGDAVTAHLKPESQRAISRPAYFCETPSCDVVYFDHFERVATTGDVATAVFPKDPSAPICSCFGLTLDDVEEAADSGDLTRLRETIAKANAPDSRCTLLSPQGRKCTAALQRAYMRYQTSRGQ